LSLGSLNSSAPIRRRREAKLAKVSPTEVGFSGIMAQTPLDSEGGQAEIGAARCALARLGAALIGLVTIGGAIHAAGRVR
jgi:hypothetical protein